MPPPLPYFKVNPFPFPHFASIFSPYLWSFRWPNYIVTLPIYFSFRLPHLNIPIGPPQTNWTRIVSERGLVKISVIETDNVITPTLNTPTVITPTLNTPTVITPTIITPTLNTSTVTDNLCNSGAFNNPNAVRDCPTWKKRHGFYPGVGSFFRMQRYCF